MRLSGPSNPTARDMGLRSMHEAANRVTADSFAGLPITLQESDEPELEDIDFAEIEHVKTSYSIEGAFAIVRQGRLRGQLIALKQLKASHIPAKALKLVDIARGLAYLHRLERPVVHGDLRGPNIMVSDDGEAVIADFALSLQMDKLAIATHSSSLREAGAARWMAPELFGDAYGAITPQSDIYSFAMTGIELFTLRLPFADEGSDFLIPQKVQNGKRPDRPVGYVSNPAFTEDLWNIITPCWEEEPHRRPSAHAVVAQLIPLLSPNSNSLIGYDINSEIEPDKQSPMPAKRGDLTGQVKRLGELPVEYGTYSDVWLGEWNSLHGPPVKVAIKSLRIARDDDPAQFVKSLVKRLFQEASIWSSLEHPNVAPFLGYSLGNIERPYGASLISPWYPEGDVVKYLESHPEADRLGLLLDVAKGLEYLHSLNPQIVHGDLKGGNILVDNHGKAVLCDFGLSIVLENMSNVTQKSSRGATGTVIFLAPEVLSSDDQSVALTPASDVYAFAITSVEILLSKPPYGSVTNEFRIASLVLAGKRPDFTHNDLSVSFPVQDLIERCWSHDPSNRPAMSIVVWILLREAQPSDDSEWVTRTRKPVSGLSSMTVHPRLSSPILIEAEDGSTRRKIMARVRGASSRTTSAIKSLFPRKS